MGITAQASVSMNGQLWLYGSLSLLGGKILQKNDWSGFVYPLK